MSAAVWREDEREEHDYDHATAIRRAMGSSDGELSGGLPAIVTTRAPTPPMALKSKLKPPSQRTVLLSALTSKAAAADSASPLKLPSLVKPKAAVAIPSKPVDTTPNNQEGEHEARAEGSSRAVLLSNSGPRGSVVDKHRDFIKDLEEQKRKEKEAQAKQDARRRKLQKKLTEKILQEAALARQKPSPEEPEEVAETEVAEESPECANDDDADDVDKRQREKEAKRQRKRLLKKQQALLEALQAKKREKLEEEEQEKERERRRQHKLKKAVLDAIHATRLDDEVTVDEEPDRISCDDIDDRGPVSSPARTVPEESEELCPGNECQEPQAKTHRDKADRATKHKTRTKKSRGSNHTSRPVEQDDDAEADRSSRLAPTVDAVEAIGQRGKSKRESTSAGVGGADSESPQDDKPPRPSKDKGDAVHKKQHDYLARLAEQRRLKQKEEEDAKLVLEKRRRRVQLEAQQRLQEAAAKLQQQRLLEEQQQQLAAEQQEQAEDKKAAVDVHAMVARLSKLKEKDAQVIPEARDFASWKKRHGVRSDQKVFSMTGWYPVVRESLEARGWFCNEERGSPFFDLKWSLKSDDLKGTKLKEDQYVNHFFSNTAITTKVGLLHTLRGLPWHQSVDVDAVFPRAYDLNEPRDMDAFVMDFRYTFAEGVLKQVAHRIAQTSTNKQAVRLNEAFVAVLLSVGRKKLRAKRALGLHGEPVDPLEESVDNSVQGGGADEPVSELEWEVLTRQALDAPGKFRASLAYKKRVVVDAERDPAVAPGETTTAPVAVDTVLSALEKKQLRQLERMRVDAFEREKASLGDRLSRVSALTTAQANELVQLTYALREACPQFDLNGAPSRNIWIVKPAGLSRGRGIRVFNDLTALLAYADVENHKECQWVAQKYIENPLLICERKFDIRQWVLVTSWDPLTVWMNEDFYLRFSSEPYSTEDLSDQYVHLTNNSIQKYSDKFSDVYTTADGSLQVEGNMLHSDEFKTHIQRTLGVDEETFERTLHTRMKEMVVQSLSCAQDLIQHRKNACELYGYDFMLDETLRPWLIEVNSSPACDYSTPTAQRYVETGLRGIVEVIVDHREYEARKKSGAAVNEPEPSTGRWKRIHKSEYIGKPVAAFGADFQVKGTKVQRTRGKTKAQASTNVTTTKASVAAAEEDSPVGILPEEEEDPAGDDNVEEEEPGDREDDDAEQDPEEEEVEREEVDELDDADPESCCGDDASVDSLL